MSKPIPSSILARLKAVESQVMHITKEEAAEIDAGSKGRRVDMAFSVDEVRNQYSSPSILVAGYPPSVEFSS